MKWEELNFEIIGPYEQFLVFEKIKIDDFIFNLGLESGTKYDINAILYALRISTCIESFFFNFPTSIY